jgi:hypothetical protein
VVAGLRDPYHVTLYAHRGCPPGYIFRCAPLTEVVVR